MEKHKDLEPRTQGDRYSHAILTELVKLNKNLELLLNPNKKSKTKKEVSNLGSDTKTV